MKKLLSGTETPADMVVTRRRRRLTSSSHAELTLKNKRKNSLVTCQTQTPCRKKTGRKGHNLNCNVEKEEKIPPDTRRRGGSKGKGQREETNVTGRKILSTRMKKTLPYAVLKRLEKTERLHHSPRGNGRRGENSSSGEKFSQHT